MGFDKGLKIPYGVGKGSPDLMGVILGGRAFGIEMKSDDGRLSDDQLAWWRAARKWGICGGVARTLEGAWKLLEETEAGIIHDEVKDYG